MRHTVNFGVSWGWPWVGYFKCNKCKQPNLLYIVIFIGRLRFTARYIKFNLAN